MRQIIRQLFLFLFIFPLAGSLFFGWKTYTIYHKYKALKENGKKITLNILDRYTDQPLDNKKNNSSESAEFVIIQFRDPVNKQLINANVKLTSELAKNKELQEITILYESKNNYLIIADTMQDPQKASKKDMLPTYIFIYDTILFGMAWLALVLKKDQ